MSHNVFCLYYFFVCLLIFISYTHIHSRSTKEYAIKGTFPSHPPALPWYNQHHVSPQRGTCPVPVLLVSAHSTVLPILHICSVNQYLLTSCYMPGTVINIRDPVGSQCTHRVHCERETLTNITRGCITKNGVKCSKGKGYNSNTMCHERTRLRLKGQRRLPGENTT